MLRYDEYLRSTVTTIGWPSLGSYISNSLCAKVIAIGAISIDAKDSKNFCIR